MVSFGLIAMLCCVTFIGVILAKSKLMQSNLVSPYPNEDHLSVKDIKLYNIIVLARLISCVPQVCLMLLPSLELLESFPTSLIYSLAVVTRPLTDTVVIPLFIMRNVEGYRKTMKRTLKGYMLGIFCRKTPQINVVT
jgi:hypothetical protein